MTSKRWESIKLKDFVEFNPSERIEKTLLTKKIAMENIYPFSKFVHQYEYANFSGGTKFRNGDTLFARITPCLENGKTCQVTILDENEVGFGSTEYIVLRAREGISDKDYIFYLFISPELRRLAISSMIGTSGRQRVQEKVLKDYEVFVPELVEQKAIADTLSCLDNKVELNNRIINTLEQMAQAIFKSWFIDFEPFKNGEFVESDIGQIPNGWEVIELGSILKFLKGKKPNDLRVNKESISYLQYLTIDVLNGGIPLYASVEKMVLATKLDVLMVMDGASSGTVYFGYEGIVASTIGKIDVKNENLREIVLQFLKYMESQISNHNTGSAIPHADKGFISRCKIAVPKEIEFGEISRTFLEIRESIINYKQQIQVLKNTRDTLLPKLMSGEIRVPYEEA